MASFFSLKLKQALSALLSVAIALSPLTPATAQATTFTCSATMADSGQDPRCAAVRVGGVPIAYPKLQWTMVSEVPVAAEAGSTQVVGGSQALALANRTALVLDLAPSDIANLNTTFPANVPYVFARYNPLDMTLRVDLFKLEKSVTSSGPRAHMLHAAFTPAHGDHWRANRSYIHPNAYQAGVTPGVNPFSTFQRAGSEEFHEISLAGAQVAMGHAMRMAGAPLGLLAVTQTRFSQETRRSGNAFRKRVETWTYGHAKPRWMIAMPADVLSRSTTLAFASFCANNPRTDECARYQTAVSGVAFEEFTGGTLNELEERWLVDYQRRSGLGFLGALVLGVIGSFAISALMGAAGISLGATGAAGTVGGASTGTALGSFGSFLTSNGLITGVTGLGQAIAIEAAYIALRLAVVGGASPGSVIKADLGVLLGNVRVHKGHQSPHSLNAMQQKLNNQVAPRVRGSLQAATPGSGGMLRGFSATVLGDCPVGAKLASCTGNSGMVPRVDQFTEQNRVQFTKDTGGNLTRDISPFNNRPVGAQPQ